jgi:hypothetical protein
MRQGILVVQTQPVDPDRVDEYNDWYDNVHIPEMCAIPGVMSARRYRVCDRATGEPDTQNPTYLALYELEADDLTEPLRELAARNAEGGMARPEALQLDPAPVVTLYERAERGPPPMTPVSRVWDMTSWAFTSLSSARHGEADRWTTS